ncbi:MAG: metal ABC transporter permease [Deltaproteobacteria bacterium]|nr:metal ABC transporter permease [Deltaproteobacteria bacterium]
MIEALQYEYMQNALLAALLGSIACGIIGSYVVIKKIGYISGGIAHASFGGLGLGYYLGIDPLLCLLPFSLVSAWIIGIISRKANVSEDTAIGILWTAGMALGVIFIGLTPGYVPDLFSYLFGNILTVPRYDIYIMAGLDLFIIITVFLFYREFLAISYDEEYARTSGINTIFFYLFLLTLVALTVVMLIRIVGIIMVIALLTIPPSIAKQHTTNLKPMMILSVLLGVMLTLGGLWASYKLDLASGATVIILLVVAFIISTVIRKLRG